MSGVCAIYFLGSCCRKPSQIHVVDVQLPLPFSALFDDEDLVRASLSFSKTYLLLSESLVHCIRDTPIMSMARILRGTDRRVTPLQVLQLLRACSFRLMAVSSA